MTFKFLLFDADLRLFMKKQLRSLTLKYNKNSNFHFSIYELFWFLLNFILHSFFINSILINWSSVFLYFCWKNLKITKKRNKLRQRFYNFKKFSCFLQRLTFFKTKWTQFEQIVSIGFLFRWSCLEIFNLLTKWKQFIIFDTNLRLFPKKTSKKFPYF